jgi:hypothetical protein
MFGISAFSIRICGNGQRKKFIADEYNSVINADVSGTIRCHILGLRGSTVGWSIGQGKSQIREASGASSI